MAEVMQPTRGNGRGWYLHVLPEKVGDDSPLGFFQGTVRALLLVKIRTVLKTAAMKSFNPGKVSMFQELKVSDAIITLTLLIRRYFASFLVKCGVYAITRRSCIITGFCETQKPDSAAALSRNFDIRRYIIK